MKLRVKIYPADEALENLLTMKGVPLVDDNPQVFHYCGHDKKDLKRLIKKYKPDFLINHIFPSFDIIDCKQAYHPLEDSLGFIKRPIIYTNSLPLSKNYYKRLGVQAEFIVIPSFKKVNHWNKILMIKSKVRNIKKSLKDLMLWS
jgi:hypothetical protein